MITIPERWAMTIFTAWNMLPSIKRVIDIEGFYLGDKQAMKGVHGTWSVNEHTLTLNPMLFEGRTPDDLVEIDVNGDSPARALPFASRALHTVLHELAHAIGEETGLDACKEWLALSGFEKSWDDPPMTARYWERRAGWEYGPSEWRYALGQTIHFPKKNWFVREYSTKSPHEAFADAVAHIALGWDDFFEAENGIDTLKWLRKHVWEETGARRVQAASQRWQSRLKPIERLNHRMEESPGDILERKYIENEDEEQIDYDHVPNLDASTKKKKRNPVDDAASAVLAALLALLSRKKDAWFGSTWPGVSAVSDQVLAAIAHPLSTLAALTMGFDDPKSLPAWFQDMQEQAAEHFAQTTHAAVTQEIFPVLEQTPDTSSQQVIDKAIDKVYEDAVNTRAPAMARTETHRIAQAASRSALMEAGEQYAVWHTQSDNPCPHCQALDGTRVSLSKAMYKRGETIEAGGKKMLVTYEDVYNPPLHINCQCTLEME